MKRVSALSQQFTESVIRRSTVWSHQYQACNLSQGTPDDETPSELKQAAIEAISNNWNQYSDTWGTDALRQAVAEKLNRFYDLRLEGRQNVTVTCGATEAMMASLLAVVEPGDEVVVFEPSYENFRAQVLIARAKPVFVPLDPVSLKLDESRLVDVFSDRTAAIIVNNPNNPSGKVFDRSELELIARLCQKHNAIAISDEVYEHMIFDGHRHICLASVEQFAGNWIVVSSCSKTYFMTGWRIGYAAAPPDLTAAIRRCHDFLSLAAATPLQDAAVTALGFDQRYYNWLTEHYQGKRDALVSLLEEAGLICRRPQGAYYVLADMSNFQFEDSVAFCDFLMKEVGVAAVPWPAFYSDEGIGRYKLRFTFSKSKETIAQARDRLAGLSSLLATRSRRHQGGPW